MPTSFSPALAHVRLGELSPDVAAAVVLDHRYRLMAGPPALAEGARELLQAAGEANELDVLTPRGSVFAVRSDRHAVAVVCRRHPLTRDQRQIARELLVALAEPSVRAPA